jgi:hypothetical protein
MKMRKTNKWTPEETKILESILKQFEGSPSAAYQKHPDWKERLCAAHTEGAIYAKLHTMKKAGPTNRGAAIRVEAASEAPESNRLIVVRDGALQAVTCPACQHRFHVMQA